MHCAYWRLTHDPFLAIGAHHAWFPAGDHDEALSRMLYAVERSHRCGMIWGDTGLGKSRLLQEIGRQTKRPSTRVVYIDLTGLDRIELAIALANGCGAGFDATVSAAAAWVFLEDWLRGRAAVTGHVVWLLDNVDTTAESVEPDVLRLARLAERTHTVSTMILAMQRPGLTEQLHSFADFVVELTPWSHDESREFVTRLLTSTDGSPDLFTEGAWEILCDAGNGYPLRLMRIAEVALVAGCALEASHLDADILAAVVHQLGWARTKSRAMLPVA
ncbi:MAG: AAA family ATPase [Planctomycetaceae bacterium]|nr:AAA family ATPase [Planctomycetaceae bacterium]